MARFEGGYIKWYRKAYFGDIGRNLTCTGLWISLLSLATWKDTSIIWKGERRTLSPGTVVLGLRGFAAEVGTSKNTVWRWLEYLQRTGRIDLESGTQGTIVTIRNWSQYQIHEDEDGTPAGHVVGHELGHGWDTRGPLSEEVRKKEVRKKEYTHEASQFDFEALYKKYPRKEGKSAGIKQCLKQIQTQEDYAALSLAIQRYAEHCRKSQQIVRHFSSFLGSQRTGHPWRDWTDPETGTSSIGDPNQLDWTRIDLTG